jgi:predicted RNase H-like HicB family nuclease
MATYLEYAKAAMNRAQYEDMGDGTWYASIPGFDGLWAIGSSQDEAREQLYETLDGWIYVHVTRGHNQPPNLDGVVLYAPPKTEAA